MTGSPSSSLPAIPGGAARDGRISAAELAAAPLVSREGGSETRDTLAAALAAALGTGYAQAPAALSVSTTAAVRAAVLAGAAPAVISELAVADDLAAGRVAEVRTPELDLRRTLRVIWAGAANPPAGPARDLVAHRQPGDIAETSGSSMSSVVGLDQRAPDRGAGSPVVPDADSQGQQALGDAGIQALGDAAAVAFEVELALP